MKLWLNTNFYYQIESNKNYLENFTFAVVKKPFEVFKWLLIQSKSVL